MKKQANLYFIRIALIGLLLASFYGFLLSRLWYEQIMSRKKYNDKFKELSVRRVRKPPLRGKIISADNKILADNLPSYDLQFHISEMRQPGKRQKTVNYIHNKVVELAELIGRDTTVTTKDISNEMFGSRVVPMKVFKNLNDKELSLLSEMTPKIPGMNIEANSMRFYPYKEITSHILGYARKNDRKRADDGKEYSYYVSDMMGIQGLEKTYDTLNIDGDSLRGLRGEPGDELVQVDNRGYEHEVLPGGKLPQNGNNAVLTLDMRAQIPAFELMQGKTGAVVMLDASNGRVLAMVSTPSYDNNKFVSGWSRKEWQNLMNDKARPLTNRAASGLTQPGSVFKPLISLGIINSGIDPYDTINCNGRTQIYNTGRSGRITCLSNHGPIDMVRALKHSCNDYFVERGIEIGMEEITKILKSAGIGKATGLDIKSKSGLLGNNEWKRKKRGRRWNKMDTGYISIGQGIVTVTPLQVAMYTAALANGGKVYRPYLLDRLEDRNGNIIYMTEPEVNSELATSNYALSVVKQGMYDVVNARGGSGKKAKNDIITLYGKTGSAEVGYGAGRYKDTWFTCFGTYKTKTYALTVMVHKGVYGGRTCAPIAKELFIRYLQNLDKS